MPYITNWTDTSRESIVNVKYIEFREEEKWRENLLALGNLQQPWQFMTSAVFAADETERRMIWVGKKIGVQLGTNWHRRYRGYDRATVERYNKGNDAVMAWNRVKILWLRRSHMKVRQEICWEKRWSWRDRWVIVFTKRSMICPPSKTMQTLTKELNEAWRDEGWRNFWSIREQLYLGDDGRHSHMRLLLKDADHSKGNFLTMATNATLPAIRILRRR